MSRKWTDVVCAEGVDLNRPLTTQQIADFKNQLFNSTRTKGSKGNEQQVLVQGDCGDHSRSSINLFMTSRWWQRESCVGDSVNSVSGRDYSQVVQRVERLGCCGRDATGRVAYLRLEW